MRSNGISEKYITGDAGSFDKWMGFAKTMPLLIGNPLYHWTALELKRYFDIDEPLNEKNSKAICDTCNEKLKEESFSGRNLITRSNVEVICTTDDPADSLEYHKMLKKGGFKTRVLPSFRPDKAIGIDKDTFIEYINNIGVKNYDDLLKWLSKRQLRFGNHAR